MDAAAFFAEKRAFKVDAGNFSVGSDGLADMQKGSGHRLVRIVAESGKQAKQAGTGLREKHKKQTGGFSSARGVQESEFAYMPFSAAMSMLASLMESPLA